MRPERPGLAVIGAGAWGSTLALVADRAGTPTTLIVRDDDAREQFESSRCHPRSLPGIAFPPSIRFSGDAEAAISEADVVLLAIPTQKLRKGLVPLRDSLGGKMIVTAAKGIEIGTSLLPTQIIDHVLGWQGACALSGPNLALEVAQRKPSTTVIAGGDQSIAARIQQMFMGETFRVYTSDDLIGVQIGGALKNIIAIGAGIGDGLDAGDNAKAAFMTRGIAEIARLGVSLGAQPLTFAGLSGIGDLICTCSSALSRNHRVGQGIAAGKSLHDILASMGEVAEGVDTTRAAVEMAKGLGVDMPIASEMYQVLFEGKAPVDAVHALMGREPRHEQI